MQIITPTSMQPDAAAEKAAEAAASGIERASERAHQAVDRVADSMSSAAHRFGDKSQEWLATQERWMASGRDCVRRHPIASVGIALGVGLLLSRLSAHSHSQTH